MSDAGTAAAGRVVVVTGPTASGKTQLAIEIALRFGGEIVNADSMQVFRHMDIGTAKPTLEERARVPHHLFDIVTPDVPYSAGRYARQARECARTIHAADHIVVLTGGTGLYIRSFLEGLIDSGPPDPELRERLETEHERAVEENDRYRLHERLRSNDPDAAARIHPNDARRTIRALEILEGVGRAASVVRDEHAFADRPFSHLHLALDPGREVVNERIDARCQGMIDQGLLREVRELRRRYGPELRPMQAIGYRHMNPVVDGSDTLANAVLAMQQDTRHFARRQRTWLRAIDDVVWLDPREEKEVLERVERFLDA
jgi:tRNA dimethylallyltransferase